MSKILAAAILTSGLAGLTVEAAQAQGPGWGPGYGRGPGMTGGPGWGDGPAYGRGPGTGPGWRGGGPGWGLTALNLSDEQLEKVSAIQEENRRKNWETMGQVRAEQFKLRQMAFADKIDANAYAEQQRKVDELRRNMLKSRIETRNQVDAILTPEQRKVHRQFGPWWLQDGDAE